MDTAMKQEKMKQEQMNQEQQYSIRELSEITGVNAVTLRAWERRYGLLKPLRTAKGHRYYTDSHLDTVRRTLQWLDRGVAISKVRPLLEGGDSVAVETTDSEAHWQELVRQTLSLCEQFQRKRLEQFLDELFSTYPLDTLASNYFPLVEDALDRKGHVQFGGAAEQVFFRSEVMSELIGRIRHANANNHGSVLLMVNLDPRQIAPSTLLLSLALLEAGYRLVLLLEPCPLREIPYIVEQSAAVSVICHSDGKPDQAQADAELVRAQSHSRVPFFLAGQCLDIQPALASLPGITVLDSNLRTARHTVQAQLGGSL